MKKILCMIISVILIVASVPVSAADKADISIDVSLYDVNITVKTDKNGTMTARLMDDAETEIYGVYSKTVDTDVNGSYIYEFHFRLPNGVNRPEALTGTYKVCLGNNISVPDKTFNFVSPADRITFYNELNDKSADDMYSFLTTERRSFVTVDLSVYNVLSGNVLDLVNAEIVNFANYEDLEDASQLATIESGFKDAFNPAVEIAKMAIVSEDEWENFASDLLAAGTFDNKYYTATAPAEPLLDIVDVFEKYKTEAAKVTVLDIAAYAKAFDKATLSLIEEISDYGTFKDAFLYFADAAKNVIAPDMTNINALISAEKDADLWKNVMLMNNSDCDTLVANTVAEAKKLTEGGTTIPPSAGGGGFGAGGSSSVDRPSVPSGSGTVSGGTTPEIVPPEKPVEEENFADVKKSHWAYEAIEELADKGILNGKGDGNFAPDDGVTREEFVKIIVVAFDLKADGENTFADVDTSRWSAEFIAAAASLGIVNGDGSNFNPANIITRQDMAVIINRVFEKFGTEVSGNSIMFDDNADIADYAREAVETLAGAGIINGMGDGTFAPKATVTRAQAAKVVYELLDLIGGGK